MRFLIISDVHANLEALNAVLESEKYDYLLFLGDIVDYGPQPRQCLEIIKNKAHYFIKGNHDESLASGIDCGCSYKFKSLSVASREYNSGILNENEKEFIKNLPLKCEFELKKNRFYLTHASDSDLYKYIKPDISDEDLAEEFEGINADYIFLGHTHLPMIKRIGNKTVVNPGSVGQPRDGNNKASYCIWEDGEIELKRVAYDIEKTCEKLSRTDIDKDIILKLINVLRTGGSIE